MYNTFCNILIFSQIFGKNIRTEDVTLWTTLLYIIFAMFYMTVKCIERGFKTKPSGCVSDCTHVKSKHNRYRL